MSSKKVGVDLETIFGNITPSLLPVGDSILNDLQCNFLNRFCNRVHTLVNDEFSQCHNSILVKPTSLFRLIKFCVDEFGKNDDLLILHGDTLFEGSNIPKTNFLSSNKAEYNYDWHYFDELQNAFSGLIRINKGFKIDKSVNDLNSFIYYCRENNFKLYSGLKWLDFGTYSSYFKNKKILFQIREHNQLNIDGKFLIKSSNNIFQLFCQFTWLKEFNLSNKVNSEM